MKIDSLAENKITSKGAKVLLSTLTISKMISCLFLNGNDIDDVAIPALIKFFKNKKQDVVIHIGSLITDKGIEILASMELEIKASVTIALDGNKEITIASIPLIKNIQKNEKITIYYSHQIVNDETGEGTKASASSSSSLLEKDQSFSEINEKTDSKDSIKVDDVDINDQEYEKALSDKISKIENWEKLDENIKQFIIDMLRESFKNEKIAFQKGERQGEIIGKRKGEIIGERKGIKQEGKRYGFDFASILEVLTKKVMIASGCEERVTLGSISNTKNHIPLLRKDFINLFKDMESVYHPSPLPSKQIASNISKREKKTAAKYWNLNNFTNDLSKVNDYGVLESRLQEEIRYFQILNIRPPENGARRNFEQFWESLNELLYPNFIIIRTMETDNSDDICQLFSAKEIGFIDKDGKQKKRLTIDGNELCKFIIEYKLPNKFPRNELNSEELNAIINSNNVLDYLESNGDVYSTDHCVVRQIRNYLLMSGLKYGIICSFKQFIFCYIDENDEVYSIYLSDRLSVDSLFKPSTNFVSPDIVLEESMSSLSVSSSSEMNQLPFSQGSPSWSIYQVMLRFIFFIVKNNDYKLTNEKLRRVVEYFIQNPGDTGNSSAKQDQKSNPSNKNEPKVNPGSGPHSSTNNNNTSLSVFAMDFKPLSWFDIRNAEKIAEGRTGPVYRRFINGRDCICKCLNLDRKRYELDGECNVYPTKIVKELKKEVKVYKKLKSLQGFVIPNFLAFQSMWLDTIYILVTEYAGETVHHYGNLNEAQYKNARYALDKIHKKGVLHGDITLGNMVVSNDNDNIIMFIDFAFAKFKNEFDNEEEWKAKIANEKRQLECVLYERIVSFSQKSIGLNHNNHIRIIQTSSRGPSKNSTTLSPSIAPTTAYPTQS